MSSPSRSMNGCPLPSASSANTSSTSRLLSAAPIVASLSERVRCARMTLPAWLDPLFDAAQQRALDEWAIKGLGIPGIELMERAGGGLAEAVQRLVPPRGPGGVFGEGNNRGAGLVGAARLRRLRRP